MSAPPSSCPYDIREMMTTPVIWEKWQGWDGHGDPTYAAPVTLHCYRESHGLSQGGLEALRVADSTTADPDWDLFFPGDDANAQTFSLYDRWTADSVADNNYSTQPTAINTIVGPVDTTNPWLIVVVI